MRALAPTISILILMTVACASEGRIGAPTPGVVACGGTSGTCALDATFCCVNGPSTGDPAPQRVCVDGLGLCESGYPFQCDDASDCTGGMRCCEVDLRIMFACQASCEGRPQLCRTDAECGGATCTPYVCDGQPLGVCGGLAGATQQAWGCTP